MDRKESLPTGLLLQLENVYVVTIAQQKIIITVAPKQT
jgi:hypothetical protein